MTPQSAKRLLLLVGLAAGVMLAMLLLRRPHEPNYGGKPLSYWLTQLGPEASKGPYSWMVAPNEERATENTRQAQAAIQAIGIEAIPFLFDKIRHEHGLGERAYAVVWPRVPLALRKRLSPPKEFRNYGNPHSRIVWALETLDSKAVPALISALRDHNSEVQITALAALCGSGTNAEASIPSLSILAKHPNGFVRRWAIFALGRIGSNRTNAIPTLMSALHDREISPLPGSSARVRETAAELLGQLGPQAQVACPELKKLLTDGDAGVRKEAAIALWRIARDRDVMPVLIELLKNHEDPRKVIWALAEMGPDARPAVPAIKDSLGPQWWRAVKLKATLPGTNLPSHWPIGASLEEVVSEALSRIEPGITDEHSDISFLNASPLKLNENTGIYTSFGSRNNGAALGLEAAPSLVQVLHRDRNPETRIYAMLTLGQIGWKPTSDLVSTLTRFLEDRTVFRYRGWDDKEIGREFVCIADMAAEMLGQIGPDARPALVPLRQMLTEPYWSARPYAPLAIWRIDHDTNVLQWVVPGLESAQSLGTYRRFLAIAAEMGSAARPAVAAMLRGMTNFTEDLSVPVRQTLERIDPGGSKMLKGVPQHLDGNLEQ